jgi:hypothetical protein
MKTVRELKKKIELLERTVQDQSHES